MLTSVFLFKLVTLLKLCHLDVPGLAAPQYALGLCVHTAVHFASSPVAALATKRPTAPASPDSSVAW